MTEPTENTPCFNKIPIAISSCLLGNKVRFDAGHKRDAYITNTLSQYFEFVAVCPEVAIGLGTPREPIRLVKTIEDIRARGTKNPHLDVTDALSQYAQKMTHSLQHISGYIVKSRSPSCGMERLKIYNEKGLPLRNKGVGIYTRVIMRELPQLPVEEEGRLNNPALRENFIERVTIYHRWQTLLKQHITPGKLVDFHTRHKLVIMAHNQTAYSRLGRIVARAGAEDLQALIIDYQQELMDALKRRATQKQHANVLQHLLGYLPKKLPTDDRAEIVETIDQYRLGLVPLIVPITLLKHHFRHHPIDWVQKQVYLNPYPVELMLRNRI
jgi:uncharacterized protein YbgA (DUF1722 family)/uncharacterized protein YbbK (DUF523 family)